MSRITQNIVSEQQHITRENLELLKDAHNDTDSQITTISTAVTENPGSDIFIAYQPDGDVTGTINTLTNSTVTNLTLGGDDLVLNNLSTSAGITATGDSTFNVNDSAMLSFTGSIDPTGTATINVASGATLSHDDQINGTYNGDITLTAGNVDNVTTIVTLTQSGASATASATNVTNATTVTTATNFTGTATNVDTIDYSSATAAKIITEGDAIPTLAVGQFLLVKPV